MNLLPPLRIVESDEEEAVDQGNEGASGQNAASSPSVPRHPSVLSLSTGAPCAKMALEIVPKDFSSKDSGNNQSAGDKDTSHGAGRPHRL